MPDPKKVLVSTAQEVDDAGQTFKGVIAGAVTALKGLIVDAAKKLDVLNIGTSSIDTLHVGKLTADQMDGVISNVVANIGRAQVITGVEAPTLEAEIYGNPFDRNVGLLGGDNQYFPGDNFSSQNLQPVGDVVLLVLRIKTNTLTDGVMALPHNANSQFPTSLLWGSSASGVNYSIQTLGSHTANLIAVATNTTETGGGLMDYDGEIFNLASMGQVKPIHQTVINNLSLAGSWDFVTYPNWGDIGSALSTADQSLVYKKFIGQHVSGLDPIRVSEYVNLGANMAYISKENVVASTSPDYTPEELAVSENSVYLSVPFGKNRSIASAKYGVIPDDIISLTYLAESNKNSGYINVNYRFLDEAGNVTGSVTAITATGQQTANNISVPSEAKNLLFSFDTGSVNGVAGDWLRVSNLQINQGAVVKAYSESLNNALKFALRGINHSPASDYDGVDEVVFTAKEAGSYTLWADSSGTWATGASIVSTIDLKAGETKTWSGLGAVVIEHMVIDHERTQAQIRDHGWEAYDPLYLFDGDRIYQDGDKTMLQRIWKVVAGFKYGDPEKTNEYITDSDNQNFADGTINEWVPVSNGTATVTYDDGVASGTGKKSIILELTVPGTYAQTALPTTELAALAEDEVYIYEADIWIPSTNNGWTAINLNFGAMDDAPIRDDSANLAVEDAWQHLVFITKLGVDIAGTVGVYAPSVIAGSKLYATNFTVKRMNIYQSTTEAPEDITHLVREGSLIQATSIGQNHINADARAIVQVTHKTGPQAIADGVRNNSITKLDKADHWKNNEFRLLLPNMVSGDSELLIYTDYPNVDNWIENPKKIIEAHSLNLSVEVYSNLAVITATGAVAVDSELSFIVADGNPVEIVDLR